MNFCRWTRPNLPCAGMNHMLRLRTGSFLTIQRLAQMLLVSPEYFNFCPFCETNEPETIEHMSVSCSRWLVFRSLHFGFDEELLFIIRQLDFTEVSVLLLEGELRGENNHIGHIFIDGDHITLRTIAFITTCVKLGLHESTPDRVRQSFNTGQSLPGPVVPRRREF